MARKTHSVAKFQHRINRLLGLDFITQAQKKVLCITLETILHDTGNYDGFGYRSGEYDPETEYSRHYYVSTNLTAEYMKLDEGK